MLAIKNEAGPQIIRRIASARRVVYAYFIDVLRMVVQIPRPGRQSDIATFDTKQNLSEIVSLSREARPVKEVRCYNKFHDDPNLSSCNIRFNRLINQNL